VIYRMDLIYDIGVFDGLDTDYYLHKGYSVLCVEADPQLCRKLSDKYARQIAAGRVILVNRALSVDDLPKTLYVNNGLGEWSSLIESTGSRMSGSTPVGVECCTLDGLFQRYGVPYYLKIDIEAMECACLKVMNTELLPEFISIEFSQTESLDVLYDKGYRTFQLVQQQDHPADGDWIFSTYPCPTGRLSHLLPADRWKDRNAVRAEYERINREGIWFDLHAALPKATSWASRTRTTPASA